MKKGILFITLLVATAVSFYFVSGTYAKYTTTFTGTSSAKVAQWKFDYTENVDLFAVLYEAKGEIWDQPGGGVNKVLDSDVTPGKIAPGTYGEYSFTLSGESETSYKIQFDFDGTEDITNGGITYFYDGMECDTIEELTELINYNFADKVFEPGQQPDYNSATGDNTVLTHTIGVLWNFEGNDKNDTALGIAAANGEKPEVNLVVHIEVIQVD